MKSRERSGKSTCGKYSKETPRMKIMGYAQQQSRLAHHFILYSRMRLDRFGKLFVEKSRDNPHSDLNVKYWSQLFDFWNPFWSPLRWAQAQNFIAESVSCWNPGLHYWCRLLRHVAWFSLQWHWSRFAHGPPTATYCLLSLVLSSSVLALRFELVLSQATFQIENGLRERFPPKPSPTSRANGYFSRKITVPGLSTPKNRSTRTSLIFVGT